MNSPGTAPLTNSDTAGANHLHRPIVALVGNPNTGKTALFNALTGFRRLTANYPGVTVDVARGPIRGASRPLELLDLPGTYSLAAHSPDEMVVCNALCGRIPGAARPAVIVGIVDASNPLRNFYLLSQLLDVGLPVVLAVNMTDLAAARGIHIDTARLSERLGVPVIPVVAIHPETVQPVVAAIEQALGAEPPKVRVPLPDTLLAETAQVQAGAGIPLRHAEALRVLIDQEGYAEAQCVKQGGDRQAIQQARARLRAAGLDPAAAEVRVRYAWVDRLLADVVIRSVPRSKSRTARLDRLLTGRFTGLLGLLLILYGLFYAIYSLADPLMGSIEGVLGWVGTQAANLLPAGILQSLVVDGLIAGVGGVLVFLPQILILFLFIAVLEDCGYLARAAFLVDRLMRPLGLSGRAFIPLLSSFACAVPAIMGTRAIADRRERFITILIAPYMSCSARLPVYVLLIGAFIPAHTWLGGWLRLDALVMLGMYLVGVLVAIPVALVLRKIVFAGPPAGFLLELPSYKLPRLRTVWQRIYMAGVSFVLRAGTVILLVNMVVWALGYFPHAQAPADATADSEAVVGHQLEASYLGQIGHAIEPVIRPLGWDWRIGVGVVSSFPAREVIVATLGTVASLETPGAEAPPIEEAIKEMHHPDGRPLFTVPVALSVMIFFALCAQCAATLVTIGKETGSWGWPVVSFISMTLIAYAAAWLTVTIGRACGG